MTRRVKEKDLSVPALKIMSSEPRGTIHINKLIRKVEDLLRPEGEDAKILDNRSDTNYLRKFVILFLTALLQPTSLTTVMPSIMPTTKL